MSHFLKLVTVVLTTILMTSCDRARPQIRVLSDNPWIWSAVSLYNQENPQKVLLLFDYHSNLESWMAHPEYRKADIIVTESPPGPITSYLPLISQQNLLFKENIYPGVEQLIKDRPTLLPLLLSPPLYLVSASPPWDKLQFLTPSVLSGLDVELVEKHVPELIRESLALASHPDYRGAVVPDSWRQLTPSSSTTPWYLRIQQLDPQLPLMPISLFDFYEFVNYQPDPTYQVINLADEQGRWTPRSISWLMLDKEQDRSARKASLQFVEWLILRENQRRLALRDDTPGFLGCFSLYPDVNLEWIEKKLPALSDRVFVNGILPTLTNGPTSLTKTNF